MKKRKLFDELMEGVEAMKKHREGKIKLPSRRVTLPKPAKANAK